MLKSLPRTSLLIAALATSFLSGCGGGSTSTAQSPTGQTIRLPGGMTVAVATALSSPVTATGSGVAVTGLAGAEITGLTLTPSNIDLSNTQILFYRANNSLMGVAPDGSNLVKFPIVNSYSRSTYSPSGNLIAYEGSNSGVQIMLASGAGSSSYPPGAGLAGFPDNPAWSPDGSHIAYEFGSADIFIDTMTVSGTGIKTLSTSPFCQSPSYAPSGWAVYYSNGSGICYIPVAGGKEFQVTNNVGDSDPEVSPSSQLLAFSNNGSIYTAGSTNGGGRTQLTKPATGIIDSGPQWSPDGSKIVFSRTTGSNLSEIWMMNTDGSSPHRILSAGDNYDAFPSWSPFFQTRSIVGTNGYLESTASGFLYGMSGTKFTSVLAFDCPPADRSSAKIVNQSGQTGASNLVFQVSATAFSSMSFANGIGEVRNAVLTSTNAGSVAGVLVNMDGTTGEIIAVLPYASPALVRGKVAHATVEGGTRVFRGEFLGVYDRMGKNLSPSGASVVTTDLQSGKILAVR